MLLSKNEHTYGIENHPLQDVSPPPPEEILKHVRGLLHDWEHNPHRQRPSHILNDLVDLLNATEIPDPDQLPKPTPGRGHLLADVQRDLILRIVEELGGNRTRAAQVLGVSVRTVRNKLNQYNVDKAL